MGKTWVSGTLHHLPRITIQGRDTFIAWCGAFDWNFWAATDQFAEDTCSACQDHCFGLAESDHV